MEVETREFKFSISGEFIPNIAREWFYLESRPLEKVMDLLLSCMCGTDMSEEVIYMNILEIILEEIKSLDDPYYKDYIDRNQVMEIIRSHMNE